MPELDNDENRVLVEEQDKEIKQLNKTITKLRKEKERQGNTIQEKRNSISQITKDLEEAINMTQNFNIEAPYVHCKINVVKGGRSPKTEISLSAGGAIDQISFPDVETFAEKLILIIKKEIDDTMDNLVIEE